MARVVLIIRSFTWVPVCLSFMFNKTELKSDPYSALYENFGPVDIKIFQDYDREYTTHLVAKKRNTSKGLRALLDGKYIVYHDTFVPALIEATTPNGEGIVPMEDDFSKLPDPLQFLPPRGAELTDRDSTAYAPDSQRRDMFDGYTFIFYDEAQYENLSGTIFAGKGKALFQRVVPEETTVLDFVRYVKNVAGEKGLGEFEDGSEGKGVVVVNYQPTKGVSIPWYHQFAVDIALSLDQRLVGQGEFLDVILGTDPSVLRRALEESPTSTMVPGMFSSPAICNGRPLIYVAAPVVTQSVQPSQAAPAETLAETPAETISQPVRKGRGRRAAVPVFKGFDDEEWATPAVNLNSIPEANSMVIDQTPAESQSLFVSQQELSMEIDRSIPEAPTILARPSRKRPVAVIDDQELINSLAPNAARLKRRRLEEAAERKDRGESTPPPRPPPEPPKEKIPEPEPEPKAKPKRRTRKEIDDAAASITAQHSKEADEAELYGGQDVIDYDGIDVDAVREGIEVLEMNISRKAPLRRQLQADESERWDDKWNGRKDFKKFRRHGAAPRRQHDRVIVQLEEAKKKDYGIGDEYWGEDPSMKESQRAGKKSKRQKGRGQEVQGDGDEGQDSDDVSMGVTRRARERSTPNRIDESDNEEDPIVVPSSDEELEEEPAVAFAAKRHTRTQSTTQSSSLNDKTASTKNIPAKGTGKRVAEKVLEKAAPVKRARQTTLDVAKVAPRAGTGRRTREREKEETDDSDDMGFGFRRRK
jgi:nijmegen breakage syndrome protein 1